MEGFDFLLVLAVFTWAGIVTGFQYAEYKHKAHKKNVTQEVVYLNANMKFTEDELRYLDKLVRDDINRTVVNAPKFKFKVKVKQVIVKSIKTSCK